MSIGRWIFIHMIELAHKNNNMFRYDVFFNTFFIRVGALFGQAFSTWRQDFRHLYAFFSASSSNQVSTLVLRTPPDRPTQLSKDILDRHFQLLKCLFLGQD